jgi:hypothetical protein
VLKDWEKEAVLFIERYHSVYGAMPEDRAIIEYLTITKKFEHVNSVTIINLKENEFFIKSMEARGIPVGQTSLSSKQMAAAALMLNLVDRRSDEKKLRDIGVSTEEWSTWMQNRDFAKYVAERAEALVANSVHEAHLGLMRGVRQGNTSAISLYYKLTGRYDPDQENQVNVRMLIGRILEAIQKHVQDPETLNRLAVEMSQLAIEAGSPVGKGSIVPESATMKELM